MNRYYCWICGEELLDSMSAFNPVQERTIMSGIKVKEVCEQCEKEITDLIVSLKNKKEV